MPIDNIDRTVGIPTTPIPGRLRSVAVFGGVAEAGEIIDDSMQASQSQINSEVNNKLVELEEAIQGTYTPIEVEDHLSTTSTKPVQNKVISNALNSKVGTNDIDNILTTKIGEQNLVNSNYLSSNYYNKNYIDTNFATKQEISSIVQAEVDPIFTESPASQITTQDITNWNSVPAWAKNSTKPTYTASEVGALPANYTPPVTSVNNQTGAVNLSIPTTQDIQAAITVNPYTIEGGVPIATVNGQEIYAPTADGTSVVRVQSDWNVTDTTSGAYIANKPNLATVARSGSYNDLSNKPTIPTMPTWSTLSGKPTLAAVATSGSYNDLIDKPTISGNYLPLTGGTISGELYINNPSSDEEVHAPLHLKYNSHYDVPIKITLTDYNDKSYLIKFPTDVIDDNGTYTLAPEKSPMFTGNPRAVTVENSNSSSTIATTAFVHNVVNNAVSVTNTLSSGTRIATINGTDVYTPAGDGNIEIEQVIESGTELAIIDGTSIYAPSTRFRFGVITQSNVLILQDDYIYIMNFWNRGIMPFITYNNEIYQPKAFGANDDNVGGPGTMTFINTSFDGTIYTYKQLVLTYDSTATSHCVVTYSTHSLQFNYTSATSTLDIVTA